jgi:hypothetical protein
MSNDKNAPQDENQPLRKLLITLLVVIAVGVVAIALFCLQAATISAGVSIAAFGIALAGASLLVGGLTGLLFGIPRRLQNADENPVKDAKQGGESKSVYASNTNLEQISDWLTKILVGVGLTQIGGIGKLINGIGEKAGPALGGFTASKSTAIALIIFFVVSGFLFGYLWTRLFLGRWLTEAESASLKEKISELERQSNADAQAIQLATLQLEGDDNQLPDQAALDAAIKSASMATRSHIFYRADAQRQKYWRDAITKPKMERTIPVFRALIASDRDYVFHRNHAGLGYALKDKLKPDWKAAEASLTQAISMRRDADAQGWNIYEFNRAFCRIQLDESFAKGAASPEADKKEIVSDLVVACRERWVRSLVQEDPVVAKWLGLNKLTHESLVSFRG